MPSTAGLKNLEARSAAITPALVFKDLAALEALASAATPIKHRAISNTAAPKNFTFSSALSSLM